MFSLIPDHVKPFNFSSNGGTLETALVKASQTLASQQKKTFYLIGNKGLVYVAGIGDTIHFMSVIDGAVSEGNGVACVEYDLLLGVIHGRGDLLFEVTESDCVFRLVKGKYKGSIVIMPILEEQIAGFNNAFLVKKGENVSQVSPESLAVLKDGIAMCAIKNMFANSSMKSSAYAMLYLTCFDGVAEITAYDEVHAAVYTADIDSGLSLKTAFYYEHFSLLDKVIGVSNTGDVKLLIGSDCIRAYTADTMLVLPSIQYEEQGFTRIKDSVLANLKANTFEARIDTSKLATMLKNLMTIKDVNSSVSFSHKLDSNALGITFKAQRGSVHDKLRVEPTKSTTDFVIRVMPSYLDDVVRLIKTLGGVTFNRYTIGQDKDLLIIKASSKSGKILFVLATTKDKEDKRT